MGGSHRKPDLGAPPWIALDPEGSGWVAMGRPRPGPGMLRPMASKLTWATRLLPVLALTALVGLAMYARRYMEIDFTVESIRAFVTGLGVWGPIVFVGLLGFRVVLLLPSKLLLLAGGICFGALEGSLYGALGITLSGVLAYGFTRWLGVDRVRSQVPPRARQALALASSRGGAGLMAVGTAYPIGPLTAYHVGAALAAMPFVAFLVALAAGSAVRSAVFSWFGDVLATRTFLEILAATMLFGLAALPLLHPRVRGWLRARMDEAPAD